MTGRTRWWRLMAGLAALTLFATACSDDDAASDGNGTEEEAGAGGGGQAEGGTLAEVQDRGTLNCGVNDAVPGFGFVDEAGDFAGFDIDFCRVIAAAVLGDAEAVEFTALTADQRFTALQAGEIDVLVRNTTFTASRDGGEGAAFTATTFFDGQGMMVRADSGFGAIEDLAGATICVLSGTTTELNLASRFAAGGIPYTPLSFQDNDQLQTAFLAGQCDGWTSDKSQLAGVRSNFPGEGGGPESLVILDETFSKEPLGPVVRDGDSDWFDAVNWAVLATIQAEEFGITSQNVQQRTSDTDPNVLAFLGQEAGDPPTQLDPGLDLDPAFAVNIVTQVGNYAEIYDRNVGAGSNLGLERGLNDLWTNGGLLYAPPYR
ncbi:MAG: amino acid ABC transporter substrate-binding protein [Acidimicrobiales bacterium]